MRSASNAPTSGTVVAGRYRLEEVLGRGGSSVVYAAHDEREDRVLAVKVLEQAPEHLSKERQRLFREARLAAQIDHENVVRVLEAGWLPGGRGFLAMERLHGETLSSRMEDCFWLPLEEAVELARQLLAAVGAVHAVGVVHRDVNPANVFILDGPSPRVKLIDFGIGRDLGDPWSRVTEPNVVLGTLGYMAPEQLFGDDPSVRTDIYGVGATLYEMLTGRVPHELRGHEVRALLQGMLEPPASVDTLRPAVPADLADGVMRALSRRPDDRHGSCREMAESCDLARAA